MLSIQNLVSAKQAATYYELDDYYVGQDSRAPSMWWGKGARTLGLEGNVERETFAKLLSGTLPSGEALPTRPDGKRRVGIDLTFSAPKSVSLHALVLKDDRLFHAHEAAVSETLSYLEKHGAEARTATEDGVRRVRTKNLVGGPLSARHEPRSRSPASYTRGCTQHDASSTGRISRACE